MRIAPAPAVRLSARPVDTALDELERVLVDDVQRSIDHLRGRARRPEFAPGVQPIIC